MSKVLITGSAGYLGQVLFSTLVKAGHKVSGIDNFLYWQDTPGNTKFGDITSIQDMYEATKEADIVISLAAIVGDGAAELDEAATINVNYEATKLLLEMCEINDIKKLIFASTCSVYGDSGKKLSTETSPVNPLSLYAKTRLMSEELIQKSRKVKSSILRFATLFGHSPRMRFDLLVNTMSATAMFEQKIVVSGGKQYRPLIHVSDVADSIKHFIKHREGGVYNVSSQNVTVGEVAETVKTIFPNTRIEYREGDDDRNYRVSNSKMIQAGFSPRITLASGIQSLKIALRSGQINYRDNKYYNVKTLKELKI